METERIKKTESGSKAAPAKNLLLRRATRESEPLNVPPIIHEVLRSPSQPLDRATRAIIEPHFGQDFSNVRIHTDVRAEESAKAVNAIAYTVGNNLVFGTGQYAPSMVAGQRLLAHELTHVVQQGNRSDSRPQEMYPISNATFETEADKAADNVAAGKKVPNIKQHALNGIIQRKKDKPEKKKPPVLKQFQGISTPLEETLTPGEGGKVEFEIGIAEIEFLPDVNSTDEGMRDRAETICQLNSFEINYESENGKVTSFTGPGTPHVTIQTTYGPGTNPAVLSGYGKGTTKKDKESGKISLGYHEGSGHGRDHIEFLRKNRFPVFTGKVGMNEKKFNILTQSYKSKRMDFHNRMLKYSAERTDCIGKTIDTSNAEKKIKTSICKKKKK